MGKQRLRDAPGQRPKHWSATKRYGDSLVRREKVPPLEVYRDADANPFDPGAADVLVLAAGYSLLKPVLSFVTVKLPSVHADSLIKWAGWFVGVESRFAMN